MGPGSESQRDHQSLTEMWGFFVEYRISNIEFRMSNDTSLLPGFFFNSCKGLSTYSTNIKEALLLLAIVSNIYMLFRSFELTGRLHTNFVIDAS